MPQSYKRKDGTIVWQTRVYLSGEPVWITIPPELCYSEKRRKEFEDAKREQAKAGKLRLPEIPKPTEEKPAATFDQWYERLADYREHEFVRRNAERKGLGCAKEDLRTWRQWVPREIRDLPPSKITREDCEAFRNKLDAAVSEYLGNDRKSVPGKAISGKRALNIWGVFKMACSEAVSCRKPELRVLKVDPCLGIDAPNTTASRTKTFVYPNEFLKLAACPEVPLEWREIHTIAVYLYLRPGELRELRWSDVNLDVGTVRIDRAWDERKKKVGPPKTKAGRRTIPIPATLMPLLERMRKGKEPNDLVVPVLAQVCEDVHAPNMRKHLWVAGARDDRLHKGTSNALHATFRSWRDSGITWLSLADVGLEKMKRQAGHETITTTDGYVKTADAERASNIGIPFPPLPESLVNPPAPAVKPAVELDAILQVTESANDSGGSARESNPPGTLARPTPVLKTGGSTSSPGASAARLSSVPVALQATSTAVSLAALGAGDDSRDDSICRPAMPRRSGRARRRRSTVRTFRSKLIVMQLRPRTPFGLWPMSASLTSPSASSLPSIEESVRHRACMSKASYEPSPRVKCAGRARGAHFCNGRCVLGRSRTGLGPGIHFLPIAFCKKRESALQ